MIARFKNAVRALLPKNSFARGVSVLVGGTASAQILLVLAAPILTRLYTPEDFGLLAVYASLLALIGVISSLRYELAIPLPADDVEAANVAVLSLLLVAISTAFTTFLVVMLGPSIAVFLGVPVLANYLWLLPVGVLLSGAYTVFNYWSVRTKRFSSLAGTKLTQAIATLAIQLTTFKLGGIGLLLGQVAGQSVGTTSLARLALAMTAFKQVSWGGVKYAAVRYRRFPIFSTWGGLANTAGTQLPSIMFAALYSPVAAGLYALACRVLQLPMSFVGGAIGQVFFANAAEAHRVGKLGTLVEQFHNKLAHIGFPPAMLFMLLGPDLFAVIFGENWRQAGDIARWMAPYLYFQFVISPLGSVFSVLELVGRGAIWQVIFIIMIVTTLFVGSFRDSFDFTIVLLSGGGVVLYLVKLIWIANLTSVKLVAILKSHLQVAFIGTVCAAPIALTLGTEIESLDVLIFATSITLGLYVLYYWKLLKK